jgi:hypothetical protein
MNRLTLSIVGKTLFDADVESQAAEVGEALTGVMETFWMTMLPFSDLLERLPVPKLRARAARARARRDHLRDDRGTRRERRDHGDLLSMLLSRRTRKTAAGMTDQQVRDEAMTIFLAGHETTANALTWTWYLLSTARTSSEAARGSGSRAAGAAARVRTSPSLPFVERVGHRVDAAVSAGVDHRPARDGEYQLGEYVVPARSHSRHESVRAPARRALLRGSRAVRSRPVDAGVSARPCRSSPIFHSAAGRVNASASRSRGWSSCWCSRRSRSAGGCASCRVIRSCRSRSSRSARSTGCG